MGRWGRLALIAFFLTGSVAAAPARADAAGSKPDRRAGARFSAHPRLDATLIDDADAGHQVRAGRRARTAADDRVTVVVEAKSAAAAAAAVTAVGGTVLNRLTSLVEARVPAPALGRLADQPGVVRVREPRPMRPAAVSEAVASIGAGSWHTAGVDGAGVKVAVVDVGFTGFETKSGTELPSAVETDMSQCVESGDFGWQETPHGTAVAEVVHDVAPSAAIRLVCVDSEEDFVTALSTLSAAGVDVVAGSIGNPSGRGDGFGGPDSATSAVAALRRQGILYVASAGNYGGRHYHQDAVGDADWPSPPLHDSEFLDYVNLTSDDEFRFTVPPHGVVGIFMKWDNWPGDTSLDLDFFVDGDQCGIDAAFSDFPQDEFGGEPVEYAVLSLDELSEDCNPAVPQSFSLLVNRWKGAATPRLDLFFDGDVTSIEQATGSNVPDPATSPAALAVGAVCQATNTLQPFSSTGPLIDQRVKPDLVAPDAVSTSVYGARSGCTGGFRGTSASAPHVAGAAALLLDANPGLQVAEVQQLLQDWAVDMGPPGRDSTYGSGRLQLRDPAQATPRTPQPFTPVAPLRLFDSRPGQLGEAERQPGQSDRTTPVLGGIEVPVQVAGLAGVPTDATAVVLNVTVTGSNKPSYLTVHPGGSVPNTSNLNFAAGQIAAQHVTATVGADDRVRLANADGAVHVIIDIAGWYGPTGQAGQPGRARFTARSAPARAFDSRPGQRGYAEATTDRATPLGPGADVSVQVGGLGGVPSTATAVAMNVTVTGANAHSYLSVYPNGSPRQTASSVNWRPGQTVANLVVGSVGLGGGVRLFNAVGDVHVIVDVIGWFEPDVGAGYVALDPPTRTLDTRTGNGGRRAPVGPDATFQLELANLNGVPSDAAAVMLSVIAVGPSQAGYLTVYPSGHAPRPLSSNLNFGPGETVPNAVIAGLGGGGRVSLYNATGATHYVADLAGYFVDLSKRLPAEDDPPVPVTKTVPLGPTGFSSMVVDDARRHIFITAPSTNKVLVVDFDGTLVKEIPNISQAAGMVIVGPSLYVAKRNAGAIQKISLATLTDEGPLATGLNRPDRLTFAGGKLWTALGSSEYTSLASITLDGTVTTSTLSFYAPDVTSSPGAPGTVFVAERGLSPGSVHRIDVSGAAPVRVASLRLDASNVQDIAVSPDGTRVIPAAGSPYEFRELSASPLQPNGVIYPGEAYPTAVGVSPGRGGLLATGLNFGFGKDQLRVFKLGKPEAIFTASPGSAVPHGVALTGDGATLLAVTEGSSGWDLGIWALPPDVPPVVLAPLTPPPPKAAVSSSIPLGEVGSGDVVVDDAHGLVYVAAPKSNKVLVYDFAGVLVRQLPGFYGAAGMTIVGSTLYVAQRNAGAIGRIDLNTLTDQGPLATGLNNVNGLAFAGGKLWTALGDYQSQFLASVSLAGAVTTFPGRYYAADVTSSPGAPNMLFVAEVGLSPGSVYRVDVSSGSPVTAATARLDASNIQDLAVSPDGARVIPAAGWPYEFRELAASTLLPDGIVYPGNAYPSAVATSPARGGLLATGLSSGSPQLSVFPLGNPIPIFTASSGDVAPHGLALAGNGSALFAATKTGPSREHLEFRIFTLP